MASEVLISFYGYDHNNQNVEGARSLGEQAQRVLSADRAQKTVYLEAGNADPVMHRNIMYSCNQFGFSVNTLFAAIYDRDGRFLAVNELSPLIQRIEDLELAEVLKQRLIPEGSYGNFYFALELDRVRKNYPFRYEMESHPAPTIKTVLTLMNKACVFAEEATELSHEGILQAALDRQRRSHRIIAQSNRLRDVENRRELTKLVKRFSKDGGVIFLPWGTNHVPLLVDELKQDLEHQRGANLRIDFSMTPDSALTSRNGKFLYNADASDLDIIHDMLVSQLRGALQEFSDDVQFKARHCLNCETWSLVLTQKARQLSLDEAAAIMRNGDQALHDFVAEVALS